MGQSLRGKRSADRRPASKRAWWAFVRAPVFWIALAMVLLFAVFIHHQFALNDELIREQAAVAHFERESPDAVWDESWPPLHAGLPAAGAIEEVRALYAFAARRSDVLQYVPCYCGCEREGHRSNEDCYVRGRTATGMPQWDGHAYT